MCSTVLNGVDGKQMWLNKNSTDHFFFEFTFVIVLI